MASNKDFQWVHCWRTAAQKPVTKEEDLFLFRLFGDSTWCSPSGPCTTGALG